MFWHVSVCLSVHRGVPVSHNALQHFPECHGAAGGVPCQVQLGGVPCQVQLGRGGTLPGPAGGVPCQVQLGGVPWPGGGTHLGQHREYLLHGGRYASCVHAGGLSCFILSPKLVKSQSPIFLKALQGGGGWSWVLYFWVGSAFFLSWVQKSHMFRGVM